MCPRSRFLFACYIECARKLNLPHIWSKYGPRPSFCHGTCCRYCTRIAGQHRPQKIRIRYVVQLLVIEVLLAWFFLNSNVGLGFVKGFSEMFEKLLGFANEGTNFVFGKMNDEGLAFFFLKVLCPIVFISALIGILQHIRVLPFVIRGIGFLLSKVNGMGKLESFNAVSSLILGQSENFIAYKDILGKMSRNRMYTMAATAMSTVSMSIVGAYMTMLEPKYVVAALVLNMFSTFIVLSLINPYRVDASEENIQMSNLHEGQSFFEMLGEYIPPVSKSRLSLPPC